MTKKDGDVTNTCESVSKSSSITSDNLSDVPNEVIIKSRIKYGTKTRMLEGFLMEYSSKTSMHGIQYIFQRNLHPWERALWAMLFLVSVLFSYLTIKSIYSKWLISPMIVGFDETLIPIHKIPFPAITICPESKIETDIFNFTNVSTRFADGKNSEDNLSQEEMERLSAALHICDIEVAQKFATLLPTNLEPPIGKTLLEMTLSKNETAPFCKWNNRFYLCENILSLVATDDGICYQFNGLSSSDLYRDESHAPKIPDNITVDFNKYVGVSTNDTPIKYEGTWTMEDGYINQTEEAYPKRTLRASARFGFVALLQGLGHNLDYHCRNMRQGYKVYLNSPQNAVHAASNYFLVRHMQEIIVHIDPIYTTTSKGVRDLKTKDRQCFFNNERHLRFFKYYSESNCQFECLTNFTIAKCGCVKFSMPQPEGVRVCNHLDISCYYDAEDDLMQVQQQEILQSLKNPRFKSECNCMPACVSLNYNYDTSQARMDSLGTIKARNDSYDEHPDFMLSRLIISFKEQQFTAMKRNELYTVSTLIANCGGVLGLFFGFSSLSIVEIIYFATIRLRYNLKMRAKARSLRVFNASTDDRTENI